MKRKIESTKSLGNDAIILLAIELVENKYPTIKISRADYKISVWSNSKELIVKFKRLIRYFPLDKEGSDLSFDLSVNVINKEVSSLDMWGIEDFYIPTKQDVKNIEFVISHFHLPIDGFENVVHEEKDMYNISLDNDVAFGRYYIDKKTGKEALGSLQGSYQPMPYLGTPEDPINDDPLVELTE